MTFKYSRATYYEPFPRFLGEKTPMLKVLAATSLLFLLNSSNFGDDAEIKHPVQKYENIVPMKDFNRTKRCFVWLPVEELNKIKKPMTPTPR